MRVGARLCAAVAAVALVASPAAAATEHTARTLAFTYLPPTIEIAAGDALRLHNLDREPHTITSVAPGLFDTDFSGVTFLQDEPVLGVPSLAPGEYEFFCRFHPYPTMRGTLIVR